MTSTPNLTPLTLIDNRAWLAGYKVARRGETCPWGDESARLGWIAGRADMLADR